MMTLSRRRFLQLTGAAAAVTASQLAGPSLAAPPAAPTDIPLNIHLLNRISFGPDPESVQLVNALGYDAYLEQQLNPEAIDDAAADALIAADTALLNLPINALYRVPEWEYRVQKSMISAVLLRAIHSRRQLLERMVEFWSDHFNVSGDEVVIALPDYYEHTIRPHALGNFRTLVLATARAPAMLVYLDNFVNISEHPNENYARELMELHTLGVNGGYTEADVANVARAFTGWTTSESLDSGFIFDPLNHDGDSKQVLGHTLPAGRGLEDGLQVIDHLVRHPSTAQYISRKLCMKFVSDRPPQSLVDSTAAAFMANHGEIRPVLRHLFTSPEFKAAAGQKLRRPFAFFAAAARASGATVLEIDPATEQLEKLGQVPYKWLPPNGYPEVASPWTSTNGLLERWNTAMLMTEGAHGGAYTAMRTNLHQQISPVATVGELVSQVSQRVFGYALSGDEVQTYIDYASDGQGASTRLTPALLSRKFGTLFGLMIASPTFQWC